MPDDLNTQYLDAIYEAMKARDIWTAAKNSGVHASIVSAAEQLALTDYRAFTLRLQIIREAVAAVLNEEHER